MWTYLAYRNCFTTYFQRNTAYPYICLYYPSIQSSSVLIHFHAFLDLVALWPLYSCCLKTQPLIRCNHYRKKFLMEIWLQSRSTLYWMFIQVFYPQQQVCVNTPFIAVYFYGSSVNSISATGLSFFVGEEFLATLIFVNLSNALCWLPMLIIGSRLVFKYFITRMASMTFKHVTAFFLLLFSSVKFTLSSTTL